MSTRAAKYVSVAPGTNGKKRKLAHEPGSPRRKKLRTVQGPLNRLSTLRSNAPSALFVHGGGESGQLGLGPDVLDEIPRPRHHPKFEKLGVGIQCMAAGGMHSLLVDSKGRVWSWGANDEFALGRETEGVAGTDADELESTPAIVSGLDDFTAVSASAGDCISVVISTEGQLRAWGAFRTEDGLLSFDGDPSHPSKIAQPQSYSWLSEETICQVKCGASHVLALTTDGHVFTWGFGKHGELARKEQHHTSTLKPERLSLRNIVTIGAGSHQSFAVDSEGSVYGWGLNHMHQLGLRPERVGPDTSVSVPTLIDSLHPSLHGGARVIAIECGEFHTIFLFDNGEVYGCGRCDEYAVGLANDHPAMINALQKYEEELPSLREELSKKYGCPIDDPQLKRPVVDLHIREPVRIAFPPPPTDEEPAPTLPPFDHEYSSTKIATISAGLRYSLACSTEGMLYAWGVGSTAQLGLGKEETAETPTRVRSKELKEYSAVNVDAGGQHALVSATRAGFAAAAAS
ncbi:RCC1/BLIP-II [Guyanagaster necrorhizus]|uniref:RCC1/BLIP-II n=1 Tax=Guyanagaster necrorhizus TaxID=856835 RepID=A0A9P7VMI3_9AGAR|nr:RCC1/BLIP-II [Guyanagaster necrorhizus MCA 3950]KAG7442676.1 RCC1/BLIP-II [Guyanagaster necrorhizus MCA 3950]